MKKVKYYCDDCGRKEVMTGDGFMIVAKKNNGFKIMCDSINPFELDILISELINIHKDQTSELFDDLLNDEEMINSMKEQLTGAELEGFLKSFRDFNIRDSKKKKQKQKYNEENVSEFMKRLKNKY